MNSGTKKKVIFSSFLFFIFIHPVKSSDLNKINRRNFNHPLHQSSFPNRSKNKKLFNPLFNKNFENIADHKVFLKNNSEQLLTEISEMQQELVIESDKQSEVNDVIYAEGNVSASFRGKLLRADSLIYDKLNKKFSAKGNIALLLGDQFFLVSQLEYSFIGETGKLLDVKGLINTNTLLTDLSSNFSSPDLNKINSFFDLKKSAVLNTPGIVENWLFSTDEMTIDGEKWKSDKALFSNDLLESKQIKLAINSLEIYPRDEKLRFKSSFNFLIFEEQISIPFWLGDRAFDFNNSQVDNRWNFGYENLDKDGYFIGRRSNPINLSDDFVLKLEPQFLIQRSLKGYTKSFVKKGKSITSEKVKRNTSFEDYFALKSQITGKIKNWDLEIDKNLNSLDFDKFSDAFRLKTKLSKEINFLNSKWDKSFYGVYRERVWNGSLGESEIYSGYGSKLEKRNSWTVNGISKTEKVAIGLGNFKGEALNSKNLINSIKGNLFYSFNQTFPLLVAYPPSNFVDSSFEYIAKPLTRGLEFNTKLYLYSSIYENGHSQNYIGFGAGPEFTFGNFKRKSFDYTKISVIPFYRIKSGNSLFKFDQIADKFTLDIAFNQQIYGPIILKSKATLNLDSDSKNYGDFIKSSISLNWKKRSYDIGIYYQPHNQEGGIAFSLFGFK